MKVDVVKYTNKSTFSKKDSLFNFTGGADKQNYYLTKNFGGSRYIGQYINDNTINGLGKYSCSNGDVYYGEFKMDNANGFGILNSINGCIYEGEWLDDIQNGVALENYDSKIYMGEFYKGKKTGLGTYYWSDGSKYEGEFVDGTLEGYVSIDN